jgi:hypothetical protein
MDLISIAYPICKRFTKGTKNCGKKNGETFSCPPIYQLYNYMFLLQRIKSSTPGVVIY